MVKHSSTCTPTNFFTLTLTRLKYRSGATLAFISSKCSLRVVRVACSVRVVSKVGKYVLVVQRRYNVFEVQILRQILSTESINTFGIESYAIKNKFEVLRTRIGTRAFFNDQKGSWK